MTLGSWRTVKLVWDGGKEVAARELRPGIVAIAGEKFCQDRLKVRAPNRPYVPVESWPALSEEHFCGEIDHLLTIIESVASGKRLVEFFGKALTVPDRDGGFGKDHRKLKINPRRLSASVDNEKVDVNVVILENRSRAQAAHHICQSGIQGESAATNGNGGWATVCIWPRSILLVDRAAVPPELVLGHELIHAAHYVSGTLEVKAGEAEARKEARRVAKEEFEQYFGCPYDPVEWCRSDIEQKKKDKENWEKIRKGIGDWLARLERWGNVYDALLDRSSRRLVFPIPVGEVDGRLQVHGGANYEEVRTHGNRVALEWLDGALGPGLLNPSPGEVESDRRAEWWISHTLGEVASKPGEESIRDADRAVGTRHWRLQVRGVTEVRIADELKIRTRLAYAPTTRRKPRVVGTGVPREKISDQVFRDKDPVAALGAELQKVDDTDAGAEARKEITEFQQQSSDATAGSDDGWGIFLCETLEPSPEKIVELSAVPEDLRREQEKLAKDTAANPGKHQLAPARRGNDLLFPQGWLPTPPLV